MLDRIALKQEARGIVRTARVSAYRFTLLLFAVTTVIDLVNNFVSLDEETILGYSLTYGVDLSFLVLHRAFPSMVVWFVSIVCALLLQVLSAGQAIYHLGIRRGEEMPYGCMLDGFSFAGKVILLSIVTYIYIFLWSLLFIVPGIIAAYRYRFALYNLCENPEMGVMEAIRESKRQTLGFKGSLFVLDLTFLGWKLLVGVSLGILGIWVNPYIMQTEMGYYQQIKAIKSPTVPPYEQDDTFHPDERFM